MKMTAKIWEQHVAAARQQKEATKTRGKSRNRGNGVELEWLKRWKHARFSRL